MKGGTDLPTNGECMSIHASLCSKHGLLKFHMIFTLLWHEVADGQPVWLIYG